MHFHYRRDKRLTEGNRSFSCNAQDTEAINPVVGNLIFKHRIAQAQSINSIRPHYSILIKNIDTVFRRFRIHFPAGTQFFDGTHHSAGRHSSQFSGLDSDSILRKRAAVMSACYLSAVKHYRYLIPFLNIGGSGNDLNSFRSHIYLTYNQLIRIRMLFNFFNLAHNNLFQIFIQGFETFHLGPAHCHCIAVFLIRAGKLRHICFYP